MKQKNLIFFILLAIFQSAICFAQVDGSKEGKKKVAIKAIPAKKLEDPKSILPDNKDGFKNAAKNEAKKNAAKNKEDLKNKGILSEAKLTEERFLKSFKKLNGVYPKIDQDLGSFRTESKTIRIICRDFQYPDGDKVSILVNNIPVIYNITLERAYQKFTIPLTEGINRIAFVALNQGTSGPNTAAFSVFDDKGNLISSNEWNLATGAKATILIAKDK